MLAPQEFLRGRERLHCQAYRTQQIFRGVPYRCVVIDDEHDGWRLGQGAS
jgi:hypothetical protein